MGKKFFINKEIILGEGGFGMIFQGTWDGKKVAVKRILLEKANQAEETALKSLVHPNVVKLVHVEVNTDFKMYILELCKASLDKLFLKDDNPKKYSGPMPPRLDVLVQLASGLEYIHGRKYVHRDIKPENILIWVGDDSKVLMKWADFGLSKQVKATQFTVSKICGTSHWLAPEILKLIQDTTEINSEEFPSLRLHGTTKSDIYAEGLIFAYFLSGGRHPFGTTLDISKNVIKNKPVMLDVDRIKPEIFQSAIFSKMLAYNPDDRNHSSEILNFLNSVKENELKLLRLCQNPTINILEGLKMFFSRGVNADFKDEKGLTPLMILFHISYNKEDLIDIIRLLIHHGIDINCLEKNGWNALHFLCSYYSNDNLIDIVRLLIQHGIDIDCQTKDGWNPLLLLCKNYSKKKRFELIEIVRLLIRHGIKINCQEKSGWNALHFLCSYYSNSNLFDIVRLLIQHGIDIDCQTKDGWNPLLLLCRNYSKEKRFELIDIVRFLIEHEIDINCQEKFGWNALHFLCSHYSNDNLIDIVDLLIQYGIDINCQEKNGWNALHLLCSYYLNDNLIDIVRLLIQHKIDINCKNKSRSNAITLLCQFYSKNNLIDIVRLLIQNGIDINCKNKSGSNALTLLCEFYSKHNIIDIIHLLIQHGIDISCQEKSGWNALHFVCSYYSDDNLIDIVRLLIQSGIAVNGRNVDARKFLLYYYKKGNIIDILKILSN